MSRAATWVSRRSIARRDDTSINTRNQASHGGVQVHDLGVRPGPVADVDFYRAFTYAYFWRSSGTLLATVPFLLTEHMVLVSNTAGVAALQGVGGSITITSDGHYAELSGKTVALEPSTGFSFDSPMLPKP